jgi:hypothetical protein
VKRFYPIAVHSGCRGYNICIRYREYNAGNQLSVEWQRPLQYTLIFSTVSKRLLQYYVRISSLRYPRYLSSPWQLPKCYHYRNISLPIEKGKAIPVTGRGGTYVCETLRLPHFLSNRLTDDGEVVSLTRRSLRVAYMNHLH